MYSRGRNDKFGSLRTKADGFDAPEGSNPDSVSGELSGYHRGLRAGHVFKGVIRELGRAICLLAGNTG